MMHGAGPFRENRPVSAPAALRFCRRRQCNFEERNKVPMSVTPGGPTEPLHDPIAPTERDPPNKPMHDPPGDPTFEPPQPLTEPTPNPASDPPPEMPGDPPQRQGYDRREQGLPSFPSA